MRLMKFLCAFFVLLSSFHVAAETKIVFLNGIDGNTTKNNKSKEKISEILKKAGYGDKLSSAGVTYDTFNNPGDGFFDDKLELLAQAKLSGEALTLAKLSDATADPQTQIYYQKLGFLYEKEIKSGTADSEESRHVFSVVRDLSKYLTQEIITKNNKIIIVSHSQGTFFAEAVAAHLTYTRSEEDNKKFDANLRFVAVASVAAGTTHNRYLSASEDNALDAHVAATVLVKNFSPLSRNVNFCADLDPLCQPYLQSTIDITIHGFQETYTSELIDKKTGTAVYLLLAKYIIDSLDEINPQVTASDFYTITGNGFYSKLTFVKKTNNEYALKERLFYISPDKSKWIEGASDLYGNTTDTSGTEVTTLLLPSGKWENIVEGSISAKFLTSESFEFTVSDYVIQKGKYLPLENESNFPVGSKRFSFVITNDTSLFYLAAKRRDFNDNFYNSTKSINELLSIYRSYSSSECAGSAYYSLANQDSVYAWSFRNNTTEFYNKTDTRIQCSDGFLGFRIADTAPFDRKTLQDGSDALIIGVPKTIALDLLPLSKWGINASGSTTPLYVVKPNENGVRVGWQLPANSAINNIKYNKTLFNFKMRERGLPEAVD